MSDEQTRRSTGTPVVELEPQEATGTGLGTSMQGPE